MNEELLNDPVLIADDEMCVECRGREPGKAYVELPSMASSHNGRTRDLPAVEDACRVCGVRPRERS